MPVQMPVGGAKILIRFVERQDQPRRSSGSSASARCARFDLREGVRGDSLRKLAIRDRRGITAALDYLRNGDLLTVQEVDRLGRNLLEGLIVLSGQFERGIVVKLLEGIAAGEHTERSRVLDLALTLAEDQRRDISRKTKNGLEAARKSGKVGSRPRVIDVSVGSVHVVLAEKSTD